MTKRKVGRWSRWVLMFGREGCGCSACRRKTQRGMRWMRINTNGCNAQYRRTKPKGGSR